MQIKNPRKQLCVVIMEKERLTALLCTIPERIFKAGKKPTGVRVTPYHKPFGIRQILNALEPEEIKKIRASPFGKFVELADKPSFSGRFGRYIISRQLKVTKKHEAWFVFAGKPVFSSRVCISNRAQLWKIQETVEEKIGQPEHNRETILGRTIWDSERSSSGVRNPYAEEENREGGRFAADFFRCAVHGFSSWSDEEDPHGWQKTSLLEAREQIDRQRSEIKKLESHIRVLHQQRSSLPTVSGDNF